MAITIGRGDRGKTSLLWGGRVSKDSIRIETIGALDELCSHLGLVKSSIKNKKDRELMTAIQRDLFTIGAEVSTNPRFIKNLEKRIGAADVKRLEKNIVELKRGKTFAECCFYLPGENPLSSMTDIARTVARSAERRTVALTRRGMLKNHHILVYLNRLSDLLYLMARSYGEGRHSRL